MASYSVCHGPPAPSSAVAAVATVGATAALVRTCSAIAARPDGTLDLRAREAGAALRASTRERPGTARGRFARGGGGGLRERAA
jgi:hypothetical protein